MPDPQLRVLALLHLNDLTVAWLSKKKMLKNGRLPISDPYEKEEANPVMIKHLTLALRINDELL